MRKYKKSTLLPLAFFLYTTVMAAYFLPRNTDMDTTQKWIVVGVSYLIVLLLWLVLRKKESLMRKRWNDEQDGK